ncbi:MAG TPA: AsmA-like C-terminal region-containing protein [Ferruginibacter sp.]|nr:AsmA-like C-terminal region-containing protein [Ferruginibacter sp.]HMP22399.1 AsmA-like C-terminal region-containing protein [Ferruginibacter sp.]
MKTHFKSYLLKALKITGITLGSILLLLYLLPLLFPGKIGDSVKSWANNNLDGEVRFSKLKLSFFSHFPSLTVSLYDFCLKGSAPYKSDTLVAAKEIAFGINLKQLIFDSKVHIDKIFVSDALMQVLVNENGEANYNVYKSTADSTVSTDTSGTAMKLEKISISNSHFIYNDSSSTVYIDAWGFNYTGTGDLSEAVFDLHSRLNVDAASLYYDGEPYLKNKKLRAQLVTKINTNSLSFVFEKNDLRINKLPVKFIGRFDFLNNGYNLDFTANSTNSKLDDFVTALPPQYLQWHDNTTIKGTTDLLLTLKGKYIVSENIMPELAYSMSIRDGYIKHAGAPLPASNIVLDFNTRLPSLNTDSLQVNIDTLYLNVEKDYASAMLHTVGLANPHINARVNASLDLEQLDKALGLPGVALKGRSSLSFNANGLLASGPNPNSIRHENVLLSIPAFSLEAKLNNGYLKYDSLPQAISNIQLDMKMACPDNDYRNMIFAINNIGAVALNNFIKGHIHISSLEKMLVDAQLKSSINLAEIKNMYPIKDIDLKGMLQIDVQSKGQYDATSKKFPTTVASFNLSDGSIKTAYYPNPVSKIEVKAKATNTDGTLKSQDFIIEPASLEFEGGPFVLQAAFKNFEDIAYDVKAIGVLDIERIYKVFAQKGTDVKGYIKANLRMQGRQSDAVSGRYNRLNNEGTLEVKDIALTTEYLPKPFVIKEGLFAFRQDKMWFNNFKAAYGQSDMQMNGWLQNVLNYALTDNGILKGQFNLNSNYFNVDEWMVYAAEPMADSTTTSVAATESGVVFIPKTLDLAINAHARQVAFNSLNVSNAQGSLLLNNGTLYLKQTGFDIIGSKTIMDARYTAETLNRAAFDFKVDAKDFDIKKAYDSIKLFREMATAAGSAQGVVSLNYAIKGKLDGNMQPIYPSLEGGGVLSVQKVKLKGFKLLNAVSRSTGKDSIANPDVSKVDIKTTIKNNVINLQRFKIKVFGFRLRTEGQTSFDGRLKLRMRLGLPPFGIFGIPMRVTGTQDNPKIKLGRGDSEELSEIEYREEEGQ